MKHTYKLAKESFTKKKKETQEEIEIERDVRAKKSEETDEVPSKGKDGKLCLIQICFPFKM